MSFFQHHPILEFFANGIAFNVGFMVLSFLLLGLTGKRKK